MSFFSFLLKKKFYIHLGYAIIVLVILFFLVLKYLDIYTRHGEAYIIPDFSGSTLLEVKDQDFDEIFDFRVTDSVFDNSQLAGTIVLQNPVAGSKVKKGRNVYITTVAILPEMTTVPDLKDLTLRQALTMLRSEGLDIRTLIFEPYLAEDAVTGQYFNEDTLEAGTEIEKNSEIDLVLGRGRNLPVPLPFLIGLSQKTAAERILLSSFNVGREYFMDEENGGTMRVYRQEPEWDDEGKYYRGDYVNVWYRSDKFFDFDSLIMTVIPDTAAMDTLQKELPLELKEIPEEF
jgi:eukaryotic-like serine/threonine-protein kinase